MKYLKLMRWISKLTSSRWFLIGFFALIIQGCFLLVSARIYTIGFPLDDAWIHQTYARNLAQTFRWEFVPGQISGGSTSPLWTLLLVPGHWISGKFFLVWTFFISFLMYIASANLFDKIIIQLTGYKRKFPFFALIFLLEWHIVWAVNSGMETMLTIFFYIYLIFLLVNQQKFTWKIAIVASLLIWVRPDAITFLGIVGLYLINDIFIHKYSIYLYWKLFTVVLFSIILYGLFNYLITGTIFPNTFYAKQTEYALLYNTPIINRLINIAIVPLAGVGSLFLPFFFYQTYLGIRKRNIIMFAIVIWILGFIFLYAIRLPVTYQHGRYFMPLIPVFLLVGCVGYISYVKRPAGKMKKIVIKSFEISSGLLLIIFLALGANAYGQDVAIIDSEMVSASQWIALNTEKDSIIAAHDIGALGYYSERKIIDLAGLISPEVIPLMGNENGLSLYLSSKHASYLMTFPDWYKQLTNNKRIIYSGDAQFVIKAGGTHMNVYVWQD